MPFLRRGEVVEEFGCLTRGLVPFEFKEIVCLVTVAHQA